MADSRKLKYQTGSEFLKFCRTFKGRTEEAREAWRKQHAPKVTMFDLKHYALLPLYGSYSKCIKKPFGWIYAHPAVVAAFPQPCTWREWIALRAFS